MKIRTSFVSNSSSSSFTIPKIHLTQVHIEQIRDHINCAEKIMPDYHPYEISASDKWNIREDAYSITGKTDMTNFDMGAFLEKIGVDMSIVNFFE